MASSIPTSYVETPFVFVNVSEEEIDWRKLPRASDGKVPVQTELLGCEPQIPNTVYE